MGNEDDFSQQERREQTLYSQMESQNEYNVLLNDSNGFNSLVSGLTDKQEPQNQQQSADVDVKAESQSISEYDNTLEKA